MIEARHAGARRQRDAELLPQTLARELELLDRRAEHVLDDHQPRVRRDDQPLRRDQAVSDLARVLVHQRDGGNQLPDQAERGIDVELQVPLVGDRRMSESRVPSTWSETIARPGAGTWTRSMRRTRA